MSTRARVPAKGSIAPLTITSVPMLTNPLPIFLAATALAVATPDTGSPGFAPSPAYRLGPGDVVDIVVFEVEELSRPAVISSDGTVTLPLVGAVRLAGLSPDEASGELRRLYAGDLLRDPQITLSVKEYHSQPATVLGAVARPGVYQLRGPRRLSDVLAMAGGLAPDAGSEIRISRPAPAAHRQGREQGFPEQGFLVGARDLLGPDGSEHDNPSILAYDTVRVSRAGIIYVVGEVGRPGGFPLKDQEPITVLKALSLAEGLKRTSAPQRARILRHHREGELPLRQETPVRLRDILDGQAPDPNLEPNDILFVPHSQARSALGRAAEAAIQITTGVVIWRR